MSELDMLQQQVKRQAEQIDKLTDEVVDREQDYSDIQAKNTAQAEQITNLEDKIEQKCESLEDADEVIQRLKECAERGLEANAEKAKEIAQLRRELKRRTHAIGDLVRIREENQRLKALCQDAIDEINPHNPMAKKEMARIIKELPE